MCSGSTRRRALPQGKAAYGHRRGAQRVDGCAFLHVRAPETGSGSAALIAIGSPGERYPRAPGQALTNGRIPCMHRRQAAGIRGNYGGRHAPRRPRLGHGGYAAAPALWSRRCRYQRAPAGQPAAVDEQLEHFRPAVTRNRALTEVPTRAAALDLPGWYLVAGGPGPDGVEAAGGGCKQADGGAVRNPVPAGAA